MNWKMHPDTTDGNGPALAPKPVPTQHEYAKSLYGGNPGNPGDPSIGSDYRVPAGGPVELKSFFVFWTNSEDDSENGFEQFADGADAIEHINEVVDGSTYPNDLTFTVVEGVERNLKKVGYSLE